MRITKANNHSVQRRLLSFTLAALASVPAAAADDSISTDRPDFVESSDVVARGVLQIETGVNYERDDHADDPTRTYTTPTLFRYGIGSGLELRLETDGRVIQETRAAEGNSTERGFSDVSLGIKWHFSDGVQSTHRPAIAFLLHADLPSGTSAFRGEGVRPSLRGVAEWEFSDSMSIGVMPGVVYDQSEMHRFWSGIFAVTTSKQLTEKLRGFVEIAGQQFAHTEDGGNLITFDTGLTYLLSKSVQIDCAVSRGINNITPDWSVGGGISIRL